MACFVIGTTLPQIVGIERVYDILLLDVKHLGVGVFLMNVFDLGT